MIEIASNSDKMTPKFSSPHGIPPAAASESGRSCKVRSCELLKNRPVEGAMLSHCANSQCARPFLRLGEGRLFQVETAGYGVAAGDLTAQPSPHLRHAPRRVERFWLCDQCAQVWTLVHDRNQGVVLAALPMTLASVRLSPKEQGPRRQTA